ncbi:Hypothetical predicted protein [Mytilus galloprovincialis]|uniref:Uncharacterized protein n=1 Tax=Mytilus galloprovincialis TaxID=29158 RepID=A0A8B6BIH7_MYTGA|nr:Hypothetical predicted protein [Mytilus galloprovincialis]
MQVKEEPKEQEFKSCQYGSYQNNRSLYNTNCTVEHFMGKPEISNIHCQKQIETKHNDLTMSQNTLHTLPKHREMSHALPKRIAQMQHRLQHGSVKKGNLAQPKLSRFKPYVYHHYSNQSFNKQISNAEKDRFPNSDDMNSCEDRNMRYMNTLPSNPMQHHPSNFNDITNEGFNNPKTVNEQESEPMEGLFGWTLIDKVYIPYIFRADNKRYVCVRLLEQKILKKYPNFFPKELANREPLTSSFIKPNECRVFNQLYQMQNKGKSEIPLFNQEDVVVHLSEFMDFYAVVQKAYPDCCDLPCESNKRKRKSIKSGWVQINNTIIPYVCRSEIKFLPIAVLKHAASINVPSEGVPPTEDECDELNRRCSAEGFKFTFKVSTRIVSITEIQDFCDVQVYDLPEKDPLHHAQYLSSEEPITEGLKINTHQTDLPNSFPEFSPEKSAPYMEHMEYQQEYMQPPMTFIYNRFPSNVRFGSPNVTIVPQNRVPNPFSVTRNSNMINNTQLHHNSLHNFEQNTQITPPRAHTGQPIMQKTILNAFTPGQNINVNYGINIQNITPTAQSIPEANQVNSTQQKTTKSRALDFDKHNVMQVHCTAPKEMGMSPSGGNMILTADSRQSSAKFGNSSTSNYNICEQTFRLPDQPCDLTKNMCQTNANYAESIGCRKTEQSMIRSGNITQSNFKTPDTNIQLETSYQMKQKQAVREFISCIKGVWFGGKNISCLHLNKPERSGKFCLVEAVCKLYYGNTQVSEFLFTIENVLLTVTCTELEEQAFIEYYQLPVKVLKCNKMIELTAFEKLFPQLTEVLNGYSPHYNPHQNTRCLLPLPDVSNMPQYLRRGRRFNTRPALNQNVPVLCHEDPYRDKLLRGSDVCLSFADLYPSETYCR